MTMLHAVYRYKLDFDLYRVPIMKFCSLKDPVRNAIEASQLIKTYYLN